MIALFIKLQSHWKQNIKTIINIEWAVILSKANMKLMYFLNM